MSLKYFNIGKEKFDMNMKPWRIPWYVHPLEDVMLVFYSIVGHLKVRKHNMEGLKPPFILLQNHSSFFDFGLACKALYPVRTGWVTSIEEFNGREWLMRSVGAMYKRKFTSDIRIIKNILYMLRNNKTCVAIFPEARFTLAGINEEIDAMSYARLIKIAKVPVVLGIGKGVYVNSPQWGKHPYRNFPVSGDYTQIITKEEAETLSKEEIAKRLTDNFVYDDMKYWQDSGRKIKCKTRAEGIHQVLYQCPHCGKEFAMTSKGTEFWCEECGHRWTLTEDGKIKAVEGETYFEHLPDWYRWERENVKKEVASGGYHFEDDAILRELVCSKKGFVKQGTVKLTHDYNGFTMQGKLDDGREFNFNRSVESMYSCHIEYDYKKGGPILDLATENDTYFVSPLTAKNVMTKLHFATEELYKFVTGKKVDKE